jgi:hypothetical protein
MFFHKWFLIYNAIRSLTLMQSAAAFFTFLANYFAFLDLGVCRGRERGKQKKESTGSSCAKNVQSMPNAVESANLQGHKLCFAEVINA